MNKIITPELENILDIDAEIFYTLLSTVTGKKLNFQTDRVVIRKSSDPSQNAHKYLLLCEINQNHVVGIKRCMDNPEYLRREIIIDYAKRLLGFSSYLILAQTGVLLRQSSTDKNCTIFEDWEHKELLFIDFGNPNDMKKIKDLDSSFINSGNFYNEYGMWAAFNFLLGVIDRHGSNFILSFTDGSLHSIDNELGPFDSNGNEVGHRQVIVPVKQNIERFFDDLNRPIYIQQLRQGFVDGWDKVVSKLSKLEMFNAKEIELTTKRSCFDPNKVSEIFFN